MISIIIIVKNDIRIENVLSDLQLIQKPDKTEILVIDSSGGKLDKIRNKFTTVKWLPFHNNTDKKTTIPEQRNMGIENAHGDIIVFIDSDCRPKNDWLVQLVKPIRDGKEYIVAGAIELNDKNSLHTLAHSKNLIHTYIGECPTMNVAIAKRVYDEIGRYDTSFEYGSDVDFSWRAIRAGYKILFKNDAVIFHDVGNRKNEMRRMYVYGKARTRLYRKHTYKMKFFYGNELLTTLYPIFFASLPLSVIFPLYPFVMAIPLIKHRRNNPLNTILMKTMYGTGVLKELIFPNR